jgi:fructose-1,6-bisphosphatase/inositol monophosphatase family enzyme
MNYQEMLKIAEKASEMASICAKDYVFDAGIISNTDKDVKTFADQKMNEIICQHLLSTQIPVISEEFDNLFSSIPDKCWIVDPLDGTFNFTRGYPFYSVSIALWISGKPVLAIIRDLSSKNIYSSIIDEGANLNFNHINVSKTRKLKDAVLTTGFPSGGNYSSEYLLRFVSSVQEFKKVRAIGCASLMLCHVAKGICDAYYENDIFLWDIAAGILMVEEAGGKVFLRKKYNSFKYEVLATNKEVYEDAYKLLIH